MRARVLLFSLLVANVARADDETYFAASTDVLAGAGFEGLNVTSVGMDATVGQRFSRFFALEAVFTGLFDTQPYRLPSEGAECSGISTEQFHWETFALRLWIRAVHSKHVDFSIAPPTLAGGIAFTHERPLLPIGGVCSRFQIPRDFHGAMVAFDLLTLGLELHFDEHFGWRFLAGVEVDLSLDADLGILSVTASAGPVVHF